MSFHNARFIRRDLKEPVEPPAGYPQGGGAYTIEAGTASIRHEVPVTGCVHRERGRCWSQARWLQWQYMSGGVQVPLWAVGVISGTAKLECQMFRAEFL